MTSILEQKAKTKEQLNSIERPLSAYQYYTKAMREKWGNMSEEEKQIYITQAEEDKNRYQNEKKVIEESLEEEIKKRKIYLSRSYGRVPCVGLDNGFTSFQVIGPVKSLELFTEKEKAKLIAKGIPEEKIGQYKSVGGMPFNWRAAKRWNVKVYGGNQNNSDTWWSLKENYEGETGNFTTYNNYKGEVWTEHH